MPPLLAQGDLMLRAEPVPYWLAGGAVWDSHGVRIGAFGEVSTSPTGTGDGGRLTRFAVVDGDAETVVEISPRRVPAPTRLRTWQT